MRCHVKSHLSPNLEVYSSYQEDAEAIESSTLFVCPPHLFALPSRSLAPCRTGRNERLLDFHEHRAGTDRRPE